MLMRRALASAGESDFASLDASTPFTVLDGVESIRFSYFGAENDTQAPTWSDRWQAPQRLPSHVRLAIKLPLVELPDFIVALRVAEEAGCVESAFQRNCVPRR